MPGSHPLLSGLSCIEAESELSSVFGGWRWRSCEVVYRSLVHKVQADQAGECQAARDRILGLVCGAQDQIGDQRGEDLDGDGILRGAEEALDLEVLLDPFEGLSPARSGNSSICQRCR